MKTNMSLGLILHKGLFFFIKDTFNVNLYIYYFSSAMFTDFFFSEKMGKRFISLKCISSTLAGLML